MNLSEESLDRLFRHGDDRASMTEIVVVDFPGDLGILFVGEGLHFIDGVPVHIRLRPERHQGPGDYLELLAPLAHMHKQVRKVFVPELARDEYPRPPRYLGRSIPAAEPVMRGTRLSCGGWR